MNFLEKIKVFRLKLIEKPIRLTKKQVKIPTERLGTDYGGWIVPTGFLDENSVCYLVGAGLDISFDLAVAHKYRSKIWIVDPTPKSENHFEELKNRTFLGEKMPHSVAGTGFYEVEKADFEQVVFQKIGLWSENKTVRFYSPPDPSFISHSIVNLHKTETFFDAEVRKLKDLMLENGHSAIDLLKIDIEGAELEVIKNIVEDRVSIGVICIEFDENARHHLDRHYMKRIEKAINSLESAGFVVFEKEKGINNYSLIHESVLEKLAR